VLYEEERKELERNLSGRLVRRKNRLNTHKTESVLGEEFLFV
jgi:hypothetical protein